MNSEENPTEINTLPEKIDEDIKRTAKNSGEKHKRIYFRANSRERLEVDTKQADNLSQVCSGGVCPIQFSQKESCSNQNIVPETIIDKSTNISRGHKRKFHEME